MALSCFLGVTMRKKADPIMVSMMLSYVLLLQKQFLISIRMMGWIEGKMVNFDRCCQLTEVAQEKSEGREVGEWPSKGEVEFEEVEMRYRPETEVILKKLSFKVKGGEKVGIVGRTGAGKSTIAVCLSRIVELCGGRILLDGEDISQVSLKQLREKVTVIPQDPTLFSGSVQKNLDPTGVYSEQRMKGLLEQAGLDDILKRGGLALELTEGGANLSSGER